MPMQAGQLEYGSPEFYEDLQRYSDITAEMDSLQDRKELGTKFHSVNKFAKANPYYLSEPKPQSQDNYLSDFEGYNGNMYLKTRPRINNPDGSFSTIRSMGVEKDGQEYVIPTIYDGAQHKPKQAYDRFVNTGRHLGTANNPQESTAYAKRLSNHMGSVPEPERPEDIVIPERKRTLASKFINLFR